MTAVDSASMAEREEIVAYANELLEIGRFPEFAPQGLQVVGAAEVTTIACGVSCSRELFERAVEHGAEMVLVHHGLFWRNEPLVVDARLRGRLETLFRGDASLVAYHLALDAHPALGNNAQLAARVGATPVGPFGVVGLGCTIDAVSVDELAARVGEAVGREPLVLRGGDGEIGRLAVSTGAAGYDLIQAAHEGYDAFLTGEPEEPSAATARELGIHLIAAGHDATERFGVQALAEHLAERFELEWRFVEVDNPV
jgi:dinuclear metal center YbgI/SA1388 family protein